MIKTKAYLISKSVVWEAYKRVKANKGTSGVDDESIDAFEVNLKDNLYKLWNRMSSGSYFAPAVKLVEIEKKGGGKRPLGIPTVTDRIAQMVVKITLEPSIDPIFHADSYGYRPGKSALDAVGMARKRCWRYDWVIDLDIKGFFDNLNHDLLMLALEKHTQDKWVKLYIKRWLKAPMQLRDGSLVKREKGTSIVLYQDGQCENSKSLKVTNVEQNTDWGRLLKITHICSTIGKLVLSLRLDNRSRMS